ncbi:MAG TPA: membrane protein insertion efficiency factor YidD [Parvularculaceae bacterium]|nr:membrane protein insertion efficiency factor YidD [Amphiplicatus sp.]MCB9955808.1 membrane protein insertion efficiency factor YidD [Caulobacterales bacterium]HOP20745.1 membrane protein insertion efficiency factor YidD [Amphiplicatus sp.]HPE31861.1 membrane protein insertion efficiency factor YidD [Parvularculaceae bacterium]HRX39277.1 membrane protein insertion efficiency factor YidD [Parvularculaceae bacterium]
MTDFSASRRPSVLARAALGLLWLYKRTLSPLFYFLGARCRHAPSCSDYAAEAFRKHGAWRGFWLAFSRVSRCHPFGSHGWDPVPQELEPQGWRFWRYGDWAWTERSAHSEVRKKVSENESRSPSS